MAPTPAHCRAVPAPWMTAVLAAAAVATPAAAAGRSALTLSESNAMVAKLSVGTPPQEMRCLVDTGSADLWLPSKRCESCDNERHFHADKSSTFMPFIRKTPQGPEPVMTQISYGSGTIAGYAVQDTVTIAAATLPNQSFIIVEDAALPPHKTWDGICGLGWSHLSSGGTPIYKRLRDAGTAPVFTLVPKGDDGAYMTVGGGAEAACKAGTLAWAAAEPVSEGGARSFWVVTGGLAIHKATPTKVRFLVDTGSSFFLVPATYFQALVHSVFPAEVFQKQCGVDPSDGGLVVCDCAVIDAPGMLPLRVQLGGREFALPVAKLFKRVPGKDGRPDLCPLQMQQKPMSMGGDPFAGIIGGIMGDMPGVPMQTDSDDTETSVVTRPDGIACRQTVVRENGKVKSNTTDCQPAGAPTGAPLDLPSGAPLPELPFPLPFPFRTGHEHRTSTLRVAGKNEEVSVSTLPDGSVCKHRVVRENGNVTSNTTECHPEGAEPFGEEEDTSFPGLSPMLDLPFRLPFPLTPDGGSIPDGATMRGVQVEESVSFDGGKLCKHKTTWEDGKVKANTTTCQEVAGGSGADGFQLPLPLTGRRLQWGGAMPLPIPGGLLGPAMFHDPEDDLWVLGGAFLQQFVSIFDFEKERMGFCEPLSDAQPPLEPEGLSEAGARPLAEAARGPAATAAPVVALLLLAAGAAVLAKRRCAGPRAAEEEEEKEEEEEEEEASLEAGTPAE